MEIIRKSRLTGNIHTLDLPITVHELIDFSKGTSPQDAFPNLTAAQIEFFLTGITEEEVKQNREIL